MNGSTIDFNFYSSFPPSNLFHFPRISSISKNVPGSFLNVYKYIWTSFYHTQHYNTLLYQNLLFFTFLTFKIHFFTERRWKRWDTTANGNTRSINRLVRHIHNEQPQNYVENVGVPVLAVTFTGLSWMHSTFFNSNERNN